MSESVKFEIIDEVTTLGNEEPTTQHIGAEGVEEPEQGQTEEERMAVVLQSVEDACALLHESGSNGFVLITLNSLGQANALMVGDYATVVHATHTALCALGGIVKRVQGEHDGNPDKHASVEDFTAGARILSMHHNMIDKMQADAQASMVIEAAASTTH